MRTPTVGLALVLALVAGCHSRSFQEPVVRWERVEGSTEPLDTARTSCQREAFEKTKSITDQGLGARAAGGIFLDCMRRHGWVQAGAGSR